MQPPRPAGRGGATQSASSAAIPTAGQPVQEHGRQLTRGRGLLGRGRSASHSRHGCRLTAGAPATNTQGDADTEMSLEARADDAPSDNAVAPVPGPNTDENPAMEVEIDAGAVGLPPSSPVSRDDDDLLSGNVAAGVEAGLAHLTVSSPSGQEVEGEEASCVEAPPPPVEV